MYESTEDKQEKMTYAQQGKAFAHKHQYKNDYVVFWLKRGIKSK